MYEEGRCWAGCTNQAISNAYGCGDCKQEPQGSLPSGESSPMTQNNTNWLVLALQKRRIPTSRECDVHSWDLRWSAPSPCHKHAWWRASLAPASRNAHVEEFLHHLHCAIGSPAWAGRRGCRPEVPGNDTGIFSFSVFKNFLISSVRHLSFSICKHQLLGSSPIYLTTLRGMLCGAAALTSEAGTPTGYRVRFRGSRISKKVVQMTKEITTATRTIVSSRSGGSIGLRISSTVLVVDCWETIEQTRKGVS